MKMFKNPYGLQSPSKNQEYIPYSSPNRHTIDVPSRQRETYQYDRQERNTNFKQSQFLDQMEKAQNMLQDISQFNDTQNISHIQRNNPTISNINFDIVDLDQMHDEFINKQSVLVANDQFFEDLFQIREKVLDLLKKYQNNINNCSKESRGEFKNQLQRDADYIKNRYEQTIQKFEQHFPTDISQILPSKPNINMDKKQHEVQMMKNLIEQFISQFAKKERQVHHFQEKNNNIYQGKKNYPTSSISSEVPTSSSQNENYEIPRYSIDTRQKNTMFSQNSEKYRDKIISHSNSNDASDFIMPQFYQCPICEVNIAENKFQDHIGKCISHKKMEQQKYQVQNESFDQTIYQTQNVEIFLSKFQQKMSQIIYQLEETLSQQKLPLTKQILQNTINDIKEVLVTKDINVTKKILKKLEKSVYDLQNNTTGSYNIFLYLKGVQQIIQEKDTFLEQTIILNDISRINKTDGAQTQRYIEQIPARQYQYNEQPPVRQYQYKQIESRTPTQNNISNDSHRSQKQERSYQNSLNGSKNSIKKNNSNSYENFESASQQYLNIENCKINYINQLFCNILQSKTQFMVRIISTNVSLTQHISQLRQKDGFL